MNEEEKERKKDRAKKNRIKNRKTLKRSLVYDPSGNLKKHYEETALAVLNGCNHNKALAEHFHKSSSAITTRVKNLIAEDWLDVGVRTSFKELVLTEKAKDYFSKVMGTGEQSNNTARSLFRIHYGVNPYSGACS